MIVRSLTIVVLLASSATVIAEDAAVYETFSGVKIGRVFLAPGDRQRLDEQRLNPPAADVAGETTAEGTPETRRPVASAGYIISSSGRARVWHDGDFVESGRRAPRSMAFPGDVKVTRSVPEDAAEAADEEDQHERRSEADDDAG